MVVRGSSGISGKPSEWLSREPSDRRAFRRRPRDRSAGYRWLRGRDCRRGLAPERTPRLPSHEARTLMLARGWRLSSRRSISGKAECCERERREPAMAALPYRAWTPAREVAPNCGWKSGAVRQAKGPRGKLPVDLLVLAEAVTKFLLPLSLASVHLHLAAEDGTPVLVLGDGHAAFHADTDTLHGHWGFG